MSTDPISNASSMASRSATAGTNPTSTDAFSNMTSSDFIKMLVAELQNQDPTQPVSNTEILQEVSQIKNIQSNAELTTTLQSVLLGQNLATASSLLQKTVTAMTSSGQSITGTVNAVSISNGDATLDVGGYAADLSSVTAILPTGTAATTPTQ